MSNLVAKLPWTFDEDKSKPFCGFIETADGMYICQIYGDGAVLGEKRGLATAAFIVQACNAHHELIACIKELRRYIESQSESIGKSCDLTMIDATLAKVKGN